MKLDIDILKNLPALREKGWRVPGFDVSNMRDMTRKSPEWAHFGPGNIFRAHIAAAHQRLLDAGLWRTGISAFADAGSDTPARAYAPFDCLSLNVSLRADGRMEKTLLASVAECPALEGAGLERAREVFESASLKLATFTITEKGYAAAGAGLISRVTGLLLARYKKGLGGIALVSMDNCSKNGDRLKSAVMSAAGATGDAGFMKYIEEKLTFPWTMIDKITPRPDARVLDMLKSDGFEGIEPVVTPRGTHIAPFVNAEEKEYLVIEDAFPAGRPPLEKAGMFFAGRDTVSAVERMKVTVCLNPLHTALAIFGCLLGYDAIWKETRDPELSRLIRVIGYDEGLPVAPDPVIFSPKRFLDEVVNDRLPNPFLPDTPQRIATDTSQKLAIRFGETLKARADAKELTGIPLALAGYLRYLEGIDDFGNEFSPSPDPRLAELRAMPPEEIIADESLFGVSLRKLGLDEKVLDMYREMRGNGAVRAALRKYLVDIC